MWNMKSLFMYVVVAVLFFVPLACNLERSVQPNADRSYADVARRLQRDMSANSPLLDSVLVLPLEDQLGILEEGARALGVPDSTIQSAIIEAMTLSGDDGRDDRASIAAAWGPCKQAVERDDGALVARTFAFRYGGDIWCDGDGDLDYRYDFAVRWAINPDSWRWSATDNWVKYVFKYLYSDKLLACTLCSSPVQLIIGTNGVDVAGGPARVLSSLYIVTR
jgi:hypothetical protein